MQTKPKYYIFSQDLNSFPPSFHSLEHSLASLKALDCFCSYLNLALTYYLKQGPPPTCCLLSVITQHFSPHSFLPLLLRSLQLFLILLIQPLQLPLLIQLLLLLIQPPLLLRLLCRMGFFLTITFCTNTIFIFDAQPSHLFARHYLPAYCAPACT